MTAAKEISASMLPKLAECPCFVGAEGYSAAAERGTRLDAIIRKAVQGEPPPDDLNEDDARAVNWGVKELQSLALGDYVETREEYLSLKTPGLSRPGTADAVCRGRSWVADIKTGSMSRDYYDQLCAYAVACMDRYFEEEWTAHVLYVDHQVRKSYEIKIQEGKARVRQLAERATSRAAEPTPNEYCNWCQHHNTCYALVRQVRSSYADICAPHGDSIAALRDQLLANPDKLSAFAARYKLFEKEIARPALEALKERLESEEVPGWSLSTRAGNEYIEMAGILPALKQSDPLQVFAHMGGKMSGKDYRAFCAEVGVEPDEAAIKRGEPIKILRQSNKK